MTAAEKAFAALWIRNVLDMHQGEPGMCARMAKLCALPISTITRIRDRDRNSLTDARVEITAACMKLLRAHADDPEANPLPAQPPPKRVGRRRTRPAPRSRQVNVALYVHEEGAVRAAGKAHPGRLAGWLADALRAYVPPAGAQQTATPLGARRVAFDTHPDAVDVFDAAIGYERRAIHARAAVLAALAK